MKLIKILLLMLCLILPNSAFALHQLYADMDGINIPYGTKFELSMAQDVTTKNVAQGDMIQAYLTKDIYVNNKLILPSRTVFRGRVKNVEYSKSLSRPAKISIVLDHLVTTKGRQLSINSGLASNFNYILQYDGNLTTSGNYFKACAGSAVYNTVADLFRHGDEVIIKKDTIFNILLLSTLEIPS